MFTYNFEGVCAPQDAHLEDMCMQAFAEVLEELDLLWALEVERAQLGAIATWKRHQVGGRLGPVWIHDDEKGGHQGTATVAEYRLQK
jgi:hypothetical protein